MFQFRRSGSSDVLRAECLGPVAGGERRAPKPRALFVKQPALVPLPFFGGSVSLNKKADAGNGRRHFLLRG
jgi:hypothetical protein